MGENIRRERKAAKLTQEVLAEKVDILRTLARDADPTSADEAGLVIQSAMRALRNEIGENLGVSKADELDKIIREQSLNCSMTIGFYLNQQPHIIKTNLLRVSYERSRANHETDGCACRRGERKPR